MNKELIEKIHRGTVWAIIPARSGSKGVENKNIKEVAGHPLMAYSIAVAKLSEHIDRVVVSTDSEQYALIANRYGADTPFLRPIDIAGDMSTDFEFMEHAIKWFAENEGILPEFWVHLRCSTPLRDINVVDDAIGRMLADVNADSLRSAHIEKYFPYKWFVDLGSGYYTTLLGNSLDEANNPRQEFPDIYVPDGYVDVLRTDFIIKNNLLHGWKMIAFHAPTVTDLDNPEDLEIIVEESKSYRSQINEYMEKMENSQ